MNKTLYFVFMELVGNNSQDLFEYDLLFSNDPDLVWAEDWNEQCPSACVNVRPESYVNAVYRIETNIPFGLAQRNSCFSMQDCVDGIISLAWEDISEYENYPDPYRLVFKYGEKFESVEEKLGTREVEMKEIVSEEPEEETE